MSRLSLNIRISPVDRTVSPTERCWNG